MTLCPGTKLGSYEVTAPIGAGGMGEVYRARDTKLDRDVAVKVLPDRVAADSEALARFEREAKAVAAVSHPNILAIYDFGTDQGVTYIVTELLEGETLRRRLGRSAIPWRKAVEIGIAVADGLAAAHAKGIIHRDLKPENIFLTADDVVKILDFGLARTEHVSSPEDRTITLDTKPGTVLGTVNYMSPEQVRGRTLDTRTDIFSLGCVLYEMVTGERAFKGDTSADITSAILTQDPATVSTTIIDVMPDLDRTITRCLEKNAQQRFQSSGDLAFTLRSILADSGAVKPAREAQRTPRLGMALASAAVVLAGAVGYVGYRAWFDYPARTVAPHDLSTRDSIPDTRGPSSPDSAERARLAVLPFDDTSPEPQEWFASGMTEAVIDDLSQITGLRVISYTSVKQYEDTREPIPVIAESLRVDYIVAGSVFRDGRRVRIRARLLDGESDERIWSDRYERDMSDIIALEHDVAKAIVEGIQITLTPSEIARLETAPQVDAEAYQEYMMGMNYVRAGTKADCESALKLFDRAIERDPTFALAHVGRAKAYLILANDHLPPKDAMPQSRAAALRALALDDTLAEAHVVLGQYKLQYEWDFSGAKEEFERAIASNRSSAEAHLAYALYLAAMKQGDDALRHLNLVQEYDPSSRFTHFDHGYASYMAHDYARTIRDATAALDLDRNWWPAHLWMGLALSQTGRHEDAFHHAREAARLNDSPAYRAMAGGILAVAGQRDEALAIYDSLKETESDTYVCPYELATIPLGLGDYDTAFEEMDRACEVRADCLPWLQVDPRLDPIRDDPRFDDLLEHVGFEPQFRLRVVETEKPDRIMLAVLPFERMSSDPDTDYLSEEIPASIIERLSTLSELLVIPRSTAFRCKVGDRDIASIGRDLNATDVLTGQINTRGDGLRIRAELVDAATNRQLWSQRYDRKVTDILAIERDITDRLSEALKVRLTGEDRTQLTRRSTENAKAHRAYLEGRFWWNKRSREGYDKAIGLFDEAIRLDPDYALAYAGKADCYCLMVLLDSPPKECIPKAREAAEQALEVDGMLAEAHTSLGWIKWVYDWDWPGAERSFKRAIELNPRYPTAYNWYAAFLAALGRDTEAIEHMTRAHQLDPGSLIINRDLGVVYSWTGQIGRAIEQLHKTIQMDPQFAPAHAHLGRVYIDAGMYAEAIAELETAVDLTGHVTHGGMLGHAYAKAGRRDDAVREMEILTESANEHHVPAHKLAVIHAGLDDKDKAFVWLEKAFQNKEFPMAILRVGQGLGSLRDDPRFDDLLRRIGFEPPSTPVEDGP